MAPLFPFDMRLLQHLHLQVCPLLPLLHPCPMHRGAVLTLNPLSCLSGVNRHFHMICIRDKFSQNIGRQVPSKVIWDHLSTMYDMQALVS